MKSSQLRTTLIGCGVLGASLAVCIFVLPMCFRGDAGELPGSQSEVAQAAITPKALADIDLGANGSLHGRQVFPADDLWNMDVSKEPCDPQSDAIIARIGLDRPLHPDFGASYQGRAFGIPYVVVSGGQRRVPVKFDYADQSDPGPYPIPPDAPIEGGAASDGDRHVIVVDKDNWMLYELYSAVLDPSSGGWKAGSGAVFDLSRNSVQRRPGWTSADAAGLAVFAGLVRYDEAVEQGVIKHALRFTVQRTRRAFVLPATHWASNRDDEDLPPMGMRVRLKADFDISKFPPSARVILQALKTYGMLLADNGSNWFLSGTPDLRWSDRDLATLKTVMGANFEVVRMAQIFTRTN